MSELTATRMLTRWARSLTLEDISASARHAAARHLLDGVGNAIAAIRLDAVPATRALLDATTAPERAGVIGTGLRRPTATAAQVNGMLVHGLDFDDTHAGSLVHATSVVLPAAFAVGEEHGASGADVIRAAVAGYEIATRIGSAVSHGFHARGLHATAVVGAFSSALVASLLSGLDEDQTVNALGIAGSMAAGSLEFLATGDNTKVLHPGFASHAGVVAAQLAGAGAAGPDSILEGDRGIFRTHANADVNVDDLTWGLGEVWQVDAMTIKPYPVCQLSHATLDAIGEIHSTEWVRLAELERIRIVLPREAAEIVAFGPDKIRPRSEYEARFSVQWGIATLILDRRLGLDAFTPDLRHRPELVAIAELVEVAVTDPGIPAADAPGDVELHLAGRVVHGHVDQSAGSAMFPLSDEQLVAKFTANVARPDAAELAERLLALADAPSLTEALRDVVAPI